MNTSKESNSQPHPESSSAGETAQPSMAAEPVSEHSEQPEPIENLIRTVTYRKLKNLGNFENEVVEASAYCLQTEDPNEVLCKLRVWVHEQLDISRQEFRRQSEQYHALLRDVHDLEVERDGLKEQIHRIRTWADEYGTTFMINLDEKLPF